MIKTNKNVDWIKYIYYNQENKVLFLDAKSDNISYDKKWSRNFRPVWKIKKYENENSENKKNKRKGL